MLKELRGHTSFVNAAIFVLDSVVSGSSDNTVKVGVIVTHVRTRACEIVVADAVHWLQQRFFIPFLLG